MLFSVRTHVRYFTELNFLYIHTVSALGKGTFSYVASYTISLFETSHQPLTEENKPDQHNRNPLPSLLFAKTAKKKTAENSTL